MGNSEVGHLNIGAGRVVYQDLVRINRACDDNSIAENPAIKEAFSYAKKTGKQVHFIGLIGDGGVHAQSKHLFKLCDISQQYDLDKVFIHAITDGRDTDPRSGLDFLTTALAHINGSKVKIASLIGRYYSMDRDKRWERIKKGYDLYVKGVGKTYTDVLSAVNDSYDDGVTDEFINPVVFVDEQGSPLSTIQPDDVVICFNFRTDRLREITTVLSQQDMPEFEMKTMPLKYYTMTRYDDRFKNVSIIFDKENVKNTLGELMEKAGKKQIRIAETEKYAHVTFFFSGGREKEFKGESRILIPSPKVATYDLQPEMSAYLVRDAIVAELKKKEVDFVCLNFANGDMVGHTGVWEAITKAVEAVDSCVKDVVETGKENGYSVMIIADHGNADHAKNADGSPNTAHSLNPVPCIIVDDDIKSVENGILADVAPTILKIMDIEQPADMTGKALV
jgi:2,3-bisphosphoglycerate-independent phosphoglycerate mutase